VPDESQASSATLGFLTTTAGAVVRIVIESPLRTLSVIVVGLIQAVISASALLLILPVVEAASPTAARHPSPTDHWAVVALTQTTSLVHALGVFVAVLVLQSVVGRFQSYLAADLSAAVATRMRLRLYDALLRTDWTLFISLRPPAVLQTLADDATHAGYFARLTAMIVGGAFAIGAYAAVAYVLSPTLTIVILGITVVTSFLLAPVRRSAAAAGERDRASATTLYRIIADSLSAIRFVRVFGREDARASDLRHRSSAAHNATLETESAEARLRVWSEAVAALVFGVTVYVGVQHLDLAPAAVLVLLVLSARLIPELSALHAHAHAARMTASAVQDVRGLTRQCTAARASEVQHDPVTFAQDLRLEQVRLEHEGRTVVSDVSLAVPVRKIVALVGPSGASLIPVTDLILGLHTPTAGSVLLDGEPLSRSRLRSWRQLVAYVPPNPVLLRDTIRANLAWADPDATDITMAEALRLASADTFVGRLPERLDTVIGDDGIHLSRAERQRIVLAAALLRRPRFLVIDEPASGLDAANERTIQHTMAKAGWDMTVLLVTRRPAAARHASMIYVLEQGRVVERGRWTELMTSSTSRLRALQEADELDQYPAAPSDVASSGE
jgi:ATP-binding cassette subfamily C protein